MSHFVFRADLEKEAYLMTQEIKISLPAYKIIYAIFCTVMLSVVRGVVFTYEIGIASEPPMAMLAAVFCADTYTQEIVSGRSEIQRLYPMKKRVSSAAKRFLIQQIFLWALAMAGYGLFFVFQRPQTFGMGGRESEIGQFFLYSCAVFITLAFWGMLSNTFSCMLRNMWAGIGGCLALWLVMNSKSGEEHLKEWNVFSYAFRNVENGSDDSWICGKVLCILAIVLMAAALPKILKERG